MKALLRNIANAYAERYNGGLSKICFLFPNKRSGKFFKEYLKESKYYNKQGFPVVKTISEFITDLSGLSQIDFINSIFTLYNSYLELENSNKIFKRDEKSRFESFRRWGEIVLSDFNTVDSYLIEPEEIFKNVKDYREISTDYLSAEQKKVLKEYFGYEETYDIERFWKNCNRGEESTPLKDQFLNLWKILAELYKVFHLKLQESGVATSGFQYRIASEKIKKFGKNALPYEKIVVYGFNAINGAERFIFSKLQKEKGFQGEEDYIDFIWDATGPLLLDKNNSASRFILSDLEYFPSPDWLEEHIRDCDTEEFPNIRIISSPSNSYQLKIAGHVLGELKEMQKEKFRENQTALILPDETLLINSLYAIPDSYNEINLTMGYSFRKTGIATFFNLLKRLYGNMRLKEGEGLYFHKDIKLLLSHPLAYILFDGEEIENTLSYIHNYHKINVSFFELQKHISDAEILFRIPKKDAPSSSMFDFVENILNLLSLRLDKEGHNKESNNNLDRAHIEIYKENLEILKKATERHSIALTSLEVLQQVDRLLGAEKIGFEGEPITGLQVMGTLETRGLDFENIVIVSMNEGLMPRRARNKTFIPASLRKGYGLPPAGYSEEIFAYYFYRLISRASNVCLIYDGRSGTGLRRSGESRYLLQLRNLMPSEKIKEETWNFNIINKDPVVSPVRKTIDLKERLRAFTDSSINYKNLSASSLICYRDCQIKFFIRHVLGINPDPEPGDFLDSITVGNVLHEVMMELYLPSELQRKLLSNPINISKEQLELILKDRKKIYNNISRKINKYFYGLEQRKLDEPLPESSNLLAEELTNQVEEIIRHDLTLTPFKLYGCEISENIKVKLKSGKIINFRFAIDRLDEILVGGKPRLRIIDYKTGARKRIAQDIEEVISGDYKSEQIFQLFTYAWLLKGFDIKGKEEVRTEIYFVPDLISGEEGLPVINKRKVESFKDYSTEFNNGIENMIDNIFDEEFFLPPNNEFLCDSCEFKNICRR